MNPCMAFKTTGERCTYAPLLFQAFPEAPVPDHLRLCRTHQRLYRDRYIANGNTHHPAGCCFDKASPRGLWCTHPEVDGTRRCLQHTVQFDRLELQRRARAQREARRQAAFHFFADRDPAPTWKQVARELFAVNAPEIIHNPDVDRVNLLQRYYQLYRDRAVDPALWHGGMLYLNAFREWLVLRGQQGPEPQAADFAVPPPDVFHAAPGVLPPMPALAALARDGQNVHRQVVSEQTNRSTELLLATPDVPEHCRAHELLAATWLNLRIASWSHVRRTIDDVVAWRAKDTCRVENDRLYRRVLHALFMRIYRMEDAELRKELWRRFYEECSEAVGLCCEGHISRLCNVLVGFEEDFKPPVPFGEIVQARMSAIAEMDLPLDDKVKLALEFFDEHKVPQEQRMAWLDAF